MACVSLRHHVLRPCAAWAVTIAMLSIGCSSPSESSTARVDLELLVNWPAGAQAQTMTRQSVNSAVVQLRRGAETIVNETFTVNPTLNQIPLVVEVPVEADGEVLGLTVQFRGSTQTLFEAATQATLAASGVTTMGLAVAYVGPGADATSLALSPELDTIAATGSLTFTAVARNAGSTVVPTPVHWSVSPSAMGTITQAGIFTGAGTSGAVTISALLATGQTAQSTLQLRPVADDLELVGGSAQAVGPTEVFPEALVVRVLSNGEPVQGAEVSWVVTAGAGTIVPSGATGADGLASAQVTATEAAGEITISASVDLMVEPFGLTVNAGPPAELIEVPHPNPASDIIADQVSRPVTVRLNDAFGNPLAGIPVTFTPSTGGSSTNTDPINTDVAGNAVTQDWTLAPRYGDQTLTATTPCTPEGGCLTHVITRFATLSSVEGEVVGATGSTTDVGASFALPFRLRIATVGVSGPMSGTPIANVPFRVYVSKGAGTLSTTVGVTDDLGELEVTFTPSSPGPVELAFRPTTGHSFVFVGAATATPVGYSHAWLGLSADWSAASNWSAGTVPTAADSVSVSGGTAFAPVLSADAEVASLFLDDQPIALDGHVLAIHGDVRALAPIEGEGRVDLVGTGELVSGAFSRLRVDGARRLTGSSNVTELEISETGTLDVGPHALTVLDSAMMNGYMRVSDPQAIVTMTHAVYAGSLMPDDMMTEGTVRIRGDLLVPGSLRTFAPLHFEMMDHPIISTPRRINVANAGSAATRLEALLINNLSSTPVVIETDLFVADSMQVWGSANVAAEAQLQIGGHLHVTPESTMRVFGTMTFGSCSRGFGSIIEGFSCPLPN